MKRLVVLALALAGCGEEADEWYPINPGGGGGAGGSSRRDAAMDGADEGGGPISGRVCLITANLRAVASTCAATGAADLAVSLGTETAMTGADGSFTIMRPATTTNLYWTVTGGGIEGSLVKFGSTFGAGTTPLLPAFDSTAYETMADNNNIALGASSMIVRVTKAGAPVTGAIVVTDPDAQVLYDGDSDETWLDESTGAVGVAWIPNIAGSPAQLTVTANNVPTTFADVPLMANAVSFVAAEIP